MNGAFIMAKILQDTTKSGKQRPWRERKIENVKYADYLEMLHYRKARRVKECGEVLRFIADDEGRLKLAQTWFCKSRLCPLCNWRRAMKQSNQLMQILQVAVGREPKGRFIFLTLTEENASGTELKSRLREMTRAFNRLIKYKKVAKNLLGFVRSTEITVSANETYHQHMHVLLFVKSSYFASSANYLSQAEWTKLWQKARKLDYMPIVHVEAIKPNLKKGKNSLLASAQETAKYQVKSKDILTDNQERDLRVVEDLEQGLVGSRMLGFGGLLRDIRKELQLDADEENENLIDTSGDDEEIGDKVREVVAKWNFERQNYFV